MHKSDKVALAVCGVGVVLCFVTVAKSCHDDREYADQGDYTPAPVVSASSYYPNNTYVNDAGYFHASSHRFFPYSYNYYEPSRGYYYDGDWHTGPGRAVAAGTPSPEGASEANGRIASSSRSSSSGGSSSHGSVSGSSSSKSGSSRGGFGSTGSGSGS